MSVKTTLITFSVLFAIGLLAIVILPFVLGGGPKSPSEPAESEADAITDQGVFRSDDGGRTWQQKAWIESEGGSIAAFTVNRLVADPVDPQTLYLLTDGNGLWTSASRGDLWAQAVDEAGLLDVRSNVLDLAVNPANRREWYVAVFQKNRGRVLSTTDGGKTFREIYFTPLERFGVFDIAYDAGRGAVLIATGQGGLLESRDRGASWRVVRWFADGLVRLLVNPVNPSIRFAASSRGSLFRTRDSGISWEDVTGAIDSFSGARINQSWTMDEAGTIYLGSRHGLLRSRDDAVSFDAPPLLIPPDALPVLAVAAVRRPASRLVVSTAHQLYASDDAGASWSILASPSAKRVTQLIIDAASAQTIYAVAQP